MSGATADRSVRIAWAEDAEAVAALQVASWRESLPDGSRAPLPTEPVVAAAWRRSLQAPGDARNRMLVALERARVRGFVVCRPALDPDCDPGIDGELSDLTVAAGARGQGHGSRLVQAGVDTLRADGFRRSVCWVRADDDALRRFLLDMGWGPDGAHRELDLDGSGATTLKQVRLHTALA